MESKTTHTMFPTIGRMVMPNEGVEPYEDNLIFCNWCKWKGVIYGVAACDYTEKGWTSIIDADVTVTAKDKINSALYLRPKITEQLEVIDATLYQYTWEQYALLLSDCYNKEDMDIFRHYVETKDKTYFVQFTDSVEKGVADICPNCIDETEEQFPDYFDPPDLPPLECLQCHGTTSPGGSNYQQHITCTCN